MSENYQQFVTRYLVPKGFNSTDLLRVAYDAALTVVVDDEIDYSDDHNYAGVEIYVSNNRGEDSIYLVAEQHADPAIAVAAIAAMQVFCDDHMVHVISWSYGSDVMKLESFGGGAVGVQQGEEPFYVYPEQEVMEHFDNLSQ